MAGSASRTARAAKPREIGAPDVLGFEAVLEGSPVSATIRAIDTVITLSLTTEEFLSLLSENVEIAQGIFRLLIDRRGAPGWHTVMHGEISPALDRAQGGRAAAAGRPHPAAAIEPAASRATAAQLVGLAGIARPVTLKVGEDPMAGAEPESSSS